jgi:hypothetical protein
MLANLALDKETTRCYQLVRYRDYIGFSTRHGWCVLLECRLYEWCVLLRAVTSLAKRSTPRVCTGTSATVALLGRTPPTMHCILQIPYGSSS